MKMLNAETFPLESQQLVEASAGTGKTYTITNLYLRLLLGHSGSLNRPLVSSEILVLTFTIAATEELRYRIRKRIVEARGAFSTGQSEDTFLQSLMDSSVDHERDRRLLAAATQLMDEAAIYTIHGFCARVLEEQSFEAGILFDQRLDGDRDQLLELAAQDCFRQEVLTLPPEQREIALGIWPNPGKLMNGVKGFLFRHKVTMLPPVENLSTELKQYLEDIATVRQLWVQADMEKIITAAGFKKNTKTISRLTEMTEFCRGESNLNLTTELWGNWNAETLIKNIKKDGVIPEHTCFNLIDSISQSNILEKITSNLWQTLSNKILENLNKSKADTSQLTLDDLLTQLNRAVTTDPDLANRLSSRYPVAMVDEFQDTDDIQYGIFNAIYNRPGAQSLFMIGDPKQAVYQFRGADVFTYINARRGIESRNGQIHSLNANWRSSTPLIDAVNHLFNRTNIFDNDSDIPFHSVDPSPLSSELSFKVDGQEQKPFSIFLVAGDDKPLNKIEACSLGMAHAAEEVSNLLTMSSAGRVHLSDKTLNAGQIAFLVRNKNEAREARYALSERGIRSVYVTLDSVFLEDTATDLFLVLQAVLEPTNERAIRTALATPLLQSSVTTIDALAHDTIAHQSVTREFLDYHHLWESQDITPMIESLMIQQRIAEKWLGQPDGERQITNLRHLSELLQKQSAKTPGMHRLLKWFSRERSAAESLATDDQQLRLESDENLVKIVTMHAAKGLEYDLVYIPFGAFYRSQPKTEPALFHMETESGFETCLELGTNKDHREQAQRENLSEDMRLLYVAITRARYKCVIGVPHTRDLPKSALARLLDISEAKTNQIEISSKLSLLPEELFEFNSVTSTETTTVRLEENSDSLFAPPDTPRLTDHWRLHSYTGVSRLIQSRDVVAESLKPAGFGDDDNNEAPQIHEEFSRFSFPRGPRVGIALHSLMENIDFRSDAESRRQQCERCLNKIGLTSDIQEWLEVLTAWLDDILQTPLAETFCLAEISEADRMDELEFHFPLQANTSFLQVLQSGGYMLGAQQISIPRLEGMMTGLIDLIVRHEGRYYLIDYKSNHLGDVAEDYSFEAIESSISEHQYDLQYLIYCVALNRYLTSRLPDYDYDSQFGGVMYLFLRGMNAKDQSGVHFDKPDKHLLDRFDIALGEPTA
jgi:exodeoxyribonuclease V beta subunit